MRIRMVALMVGSILIPLSNATGAETFEVMVMRGSKLVRVTGDEDGTTSEVTIREDPSPPAPEIVWEPPEEHSDPMELNLVIQIFQDAPLPAYGWGFSRAHPMFARHQQPHREHRHAMTHGGRSSSGLFGRGLRWSERRQR